MSSDAPARLPLLRLPLGAIPAGAVQVASRGLWSRTTPPASAEAILRAYQRTVPCRVVLRAEEAPPAAGATIDELRETLERCLRYSRPRIAVPFLFEAGSRDLALRFLALAAELLEERLAGCKLVAPWSPLGRAGLHPIVEATGADPALEEHGLDAVWAWRYPIESIVDAPRATPVEVDLAQLRARRVVVDSVDVLTRVADARTWTPLRERSLVERIVAAHPEIEVWRVSDLLEGDFLAQSAFSALD